MPLKVAVSLLGCQKHLTKCVVLTTYESRHDILSTGVPPCFRRNKNVSQGCPETLEFSFIVLRCIRLPVKETCFNSSFPRCLVSGCSGNRIRSPRSVRLASSLNRGRRVRTSR
uniref:Uncharacterized protein n=1 Tax=Branchiostoma floridae TaxID=7739 RepID=C3ZE75_BRAFL|eukprot:XP_002593020.1 hypothetical protein BRAFLDRAFT_74339 [Branchiostoma floridae]